MWLESTDTAKVINLFKSLVSWLVVILRKRVCTADQFISVCNKAVAYAGKDEDGLLNVRELLTIIVKSFRKVGI